MFPANFTLDEWFRHS